MPDHVHMMISIPPKYAVSRVTDSSPEKAAAAIKGELTRWAPIVRSTKVCE